MTKKKQIEFSKQLLLLHVTVSVVLCVTTVIGALFGADMSAVGILAATSLVTTGTWGGFYFWKAKNENRAKYAQSFMNKFAKDYGADKALQAAEIVLKD